MLNIHSNFEKRHSCHKTSIYCIFNQFSVQFQNFIGQCFPVELLMVSPSLCGSSYTFKVGCRIPFSIRWVFRVLYIFNCCSGWSTNNCCSTLLGFGPLIIKQKRPSSCYFERPKGSIYLQLKINHARKCSVTTFTDQARFSVWGRKSPRDIWHREAYSRFGKNAQTQNARTAVGNLGSADLSSTKHLKGATWVRGGDRERILTGQDTRTIL